ncbi:metallophosphoesterase family protein [Streptomyces sp. H27-S2]|uniref:metallophosphoesterase family protein n=1 Tax=Streptomyces antarcticus TaxID=2996458 RepID=UPI0022706DE8|nr:metallophosphoesterase [Streptomyces sp. H27-S2]MCY0950337.1 metallophosphoesterase [Streptomyces sp. H27-S2]
MAPANLLGISDLHVGHPENRKIVENLRPTADDDWLLVAGDVGELTEDIEWALSTLRDHSRTPTAVTKEAALEQAYEKGVVCTDEFLLHPDPCPSREAWCDARVRESERRLAACDPDLPTVLVNHYPLVRHPTRILYHPEFAQWCGTARTADWHRRFRARSVVYGHLRIPRTTWHDGVCFEEVSVGYPREWRRPGHPRNVSRRVLPETRTP